MSLHIYTYAYLHTSTHMHIYSSNFVCNSRAVIYFLNFFDKPFLNNVFYENANQLILNCGTLIEDIFL